jgi:uncharacterized Ntn-hydrolase superfamily protein
MRTYRIVSGVALALLLGGCAAQSPDELVHNTFSIAAVDRETGESGVAVTTRVACVGNGVPWVRAGVGAVATQAFTRVEYGEELLDLLEQGVDPEAALGERVGADEGRDRRQVGVIALDGRSARHTGTETNDWAGDRAGPDYVTQGNLLVGPEVLEAVGRTFEASAGSGRHLVDRLIEALEAGQAAGGDARRGRHQSAAVIVADPRPGRSRRPDGITAHLNVCEHPEPVGELRRQHDVVAGILGYRTLAQPEGNDVLQLAIILNTLGYFRPQGDEPDGEWRRFTPELVAAVDAFRGDVGLSTPALGSPPGFVDDETVDALWDAIEREGATAAVRDRIREITAIRR